MKSYRLGALLVCVTLTVVTALAALRQQDAGAERTKAKEEITVIQEGG